MFSTQSIFRFQSFHRMYHKALQDTFRSICRTRSHIFLLMVSLWCNKGTRKHSKTDGLLLSTSKKGRLRHRLSTNILFSNCSTAHRHPCFYSNGLRTLIRRHPKALYRHSRREGCFLSIKHIRLILWPEIKLEAFLL